VATKDAATQTRRTERSDSYRVSWECDQKEHDRMDPADRRTAQQTAVHHRRRHVTTSMPMQRSSPDIPRHVDAQVATHKSRRMDAAFGSEGEPEERTMARKSRATASEAGPRRDGPTSLNLTSSQEKTLLQRRQLYLWQNAESTHPSSHEVVGVDARAGQEDADTARVSCRDPAFHRKTNTSSIGRRPGPPSTTRKARERPKSPQASGARSRRSEEGQVETCRSRESDASPTRYSGPASSSQDLTPSQARILRQQRTSYVRQAARAAP
jgi:hypothetical protein